MINEFLRDLQAAWSSLLRAYGRPPRLLEPDADGIYPMEQNPACKTAVVNLKPPRLRERSTRECGQ